MPPESIDFSSEERDKVIQGVEEEVEKDEKIQEEYENIAKVRRQDTSMSESVRKGRGTKGKGVGRPKKK